MKFSIATVSLGGALIEKLAAIAAFQPLRDFEDMPEPQRARRGR